MFRKIEKSEHNKLFSEETFQKIIHTISSEIVKRGFKTHNDAHNAMIGAMILKDIPLAEGGTVNVWIDYDAKLLPDRTVDAGITNLIIFDEIPDEVLDKYNEINRLAKENNQ